MDFQDSVHPMIFWDDISVEKHQAILEGLRS